MWVTWGVLGMVVLIGATALMCLASGPPGYDGGFFDNQGKGQGE
ncbi:hypothetical protein [Geoalkalibacter sp.]|nr:hypothetical protein [Geoalkalibacter sp.]